MTKIIRVTMPDGSLWDVPAELVAKNRAEHYAEQDGKSPDGYKDVYERELKFTLENDDELLDWGANNMNWADVESEATQHRPASIDYDDGWANGDKTVIETK